MTTFERLLKKNELVDLCLAYAYKVHEPCSDASSDIMLNAYVTYLDDNIVLDAFIETYGNSLLFVKLQKNMFNENNLTEEELHDMKCGTTFVINVKTQPEHFQDYVLEQILKCKGKDRLYVQKCHENIDIIPPSISTIEELKVLLDLEDI